MEVHHEPVKSHIGQPLDHRVDRCPLFGHEQDSLAVGHHRGDEIGDGLALAGSRRSLEDKRMSGQGGIDGCVL